MFRKRDLVPEAGGIFTWGGRDYHCLADLSLWLRLLARGHCFYQAVTLSDYRIHEGQEQATHAMDVACIAERVEIAREARRHGFLRDDAHFRTALSMPARMAQQALQSGAYGGEQQRQLEALAAVSRP